MRNTPRNSPYHPALNCWHQTQLLTLPKTNSNFRVSAVILPEGEKHFIFPHNPLFMRWSLSGRRCSFCYYAEVSLPFPQLLTLTLPHFVPQVASKLLPVGSRLNIEGYVCVCVLSSVWLFVTPRTIANQAPLSMGFSQQEYWSGLPCPPPGNLPNLGTRDQTRVSCISCVVRQILYH